MLLILVDHGKFSHRFTSDDFGFQFPHTALCTLLGADNEQSKLIN